MENENAEDINEYEINLMTESRIFFYEDENGNEMSFEADALIVECPDYEDLESEVMDAVGKQILTSKGEDYEPNLIIDLPKINDEDVSGSVGNLNDEPLKSIEEAVDFIKNLKSVSFKTIQPEDRGSIRYLDEKQTPIKTLLHKREDFEEIEIPGYKEIIVGLNPLYDGEKCLESVDPSKYFNVALLFQDPEDELYYVLIPVESKPDGIELINYLLKENFGKEFKKEEDNEIWSNLYSSKFFYIGFLNKESCVRINTLHNLSNI